MFSILIVEDSELFMKSDIRQMEALGKKYDLEVKLKTFEHVGELLQQYIQNNQIDLAILDIEIGMSNGIRLGRKVKQYNPFVSLVFVTSHVKYLEKANSLNPDGFLIKPVDMKQLDSLFCKAVMMKAGKTALEEKNIRFLSFRVMGAMVEVSERDIVYIKTSERKVKVQTLEKMFYVNDSLLHVEQKTSDCIVRVGRDALVNKNMVKAVERERIQMANGEWIDISKRNFSEIVKKLHT